MGGVPADKWLSLTDQVREVSPVCGFAPGEYVCPCLGCGRRFIGDKRSSQCFACAFKTITASLSKAAGVRDALENILIGIGMGWNLDGLVDVANERLAPNETEGGGRG